MNETIMENCWRRHEHEGNMDEEWIKKYPVTFKLKNHWFAKGAF